MWMEAARLLPQVLRSSDLRQCNTFNSQPKLQQPILIDWQNFGACALAAFPAKCFRPPTSERATGYSFDIPLTASTKPADTSIGY